MNHHPNAVAASKRKIDDYLGNLSPWDLLYLRRKFRQDLFIHGLAGIADLPSEIIVLIASHLPLLSIIRCQGVSHAWRGQWTSQDVVRDICRRHFPGVNPPRKEDGGIGGDWYETFLRESQKQLRRRFRKHPRTFVRWNANVNSDIIPLEPSPMSQLRLQADNVGNLVDMGYLDAVLYCKGRVAWQPSRSIAFVDDLRTGKRKRCTLAHEVLRGRRLHLVCFTEMLLVFLEAESENQGRILYVRCPALYLSSRLFPYHGQNSRLYLCARYIAKKLVDMYGTLRWSSGGKLCSLKGWSAATAIKASSSSVFAEKQENS
jgi:hypothetical protein